MTRALETTLGRYTIGALAALVLASTWGWSQGRSGATTDELVVLISGRDDHGLEVAAELPLHDEPGGTQTRTVAADTLAVVHEGRGTWLRISTLEGPPVTGWIDEFLVRGELHLVHPDEPACPVRTTGGELRPSTRVRVVDVHRVAADDLQIGVVPVAGGAEHHVGRHWVRELHGPRLIPGTDCAAVDEVLPVHEH